MSRLSQDFRCAHQTRKLRSGSLLGTPSATESWSTARCTTLHRLLGPITGTGGQRTGDVWWRELWRVAHGVGPVYDFQLLPDAAGGVRTHDLRIKSPLLYQLSYSGGPP